MKSGDILVVDDDRFLVDAIRSLLRGEGFPVREANSASECYVAVAEDLPGLVILDWGLPDENGLTVCRKLREDYDFPIIMLTSRTATVDKVLGLEMGADDYVTKPFDAHELVARVRVQLRRSRPVTPIEDASGFKVGALEIDEDGRVAKVDGKPIELTETEVKLIHYLAKNTGRALSREMLFEHVWGYEIDFNSNSLEVMVYRLRNKLEAAGANVVIRTRRAYGYQLEHV
jgi:DNA-binding response OmpR family regulator